MAVVERADLIKAVQLTALNPYVTGGLFAILSRVPPGVLDALPQRLKNVLLHGKTKPILKFLAIYGILKKVSDLWSRLTLNNFQSDTYIWPKEVAIVTGGSGGIGSRTVRGLAAKGVTVIVLDVQPLPFASPPNVHFYKADITSLQDLGRVAEEVRKNHGDPTILVNMAGVLIGKSVLDATERDIRFTFELNTVAHYWLIKEFLPSMIKNNHGHVVTIASMASYVTPAQLSFYCASKAAALALHEGLTQDLKYRHNAPKVRTTSVHPNFVNTALLDNNDIKSAGSRMLQPQDVADQIVKQILKGESGQVIIPDSLALVASLRAVPDWLAQRFLYQARNSIH